MTTSALVSFHRVQKTWRQVTALQDFTLDIARGELVALVGSSGCGKSTLLRILAGLEKATTGEIRINGEPVVGVGTDRGLVFQEPRLFPWLSVIDNVMLGLANEKLSRQEKRLRAQQMLTRVQLAEFADAMPAQLSGGMAQRAAIARGLIGGPQILMLDEPFSALDALTRHKLQQELLRIHRSSGITTLIVTHDVEEAVTLADRVVVMSPHPGKIRDIVRLSLPQPRQRDAADFADACRDIRNLIVFN